MAHGKKSGYGNPAVNRSGTKPSNLPGYKCMPKSHMPKSEGKMSSAHGTNSGDSTKGLRNADGRVGAGKRGFKSGIPARGPNKIG